MKTYVKEIYLFLKKYIKSLILGTIAITLAFSALIILQNRTEIEKELGADGSEIVEKDPMFFRFYMKLPDGYSFQNGPLMDEILNSPLTYEQLSETLSFDLSEYLKQPETNEPIEEGAATDFEEPFKIVDVNVDTTSNVFTIISELGDPDRNLEVINFYYNALVDDELAVFEANEVFIINEPTYVSQSTFGAKFFEDISPDYVQPKAIGLWDIIIAVTFAVFLMLLISILREVFHKTLNYSFAYNTGDSYDSLLFDEKNQNPDIVKYFVASPNHSKKLLLSEQPVDQQKLGIDNQVIGQKLTTLSDFKLTEDTQEIVIFVYGGQTQREWYKNEINYARVLKLPVKTVHFMA